MKVFAEHPLPSWQAGPGLRLPAMRRLRRFGSVLLFALGFLLRPAAGAMKPPPAVDAVDLGELSLEELLEIRIAKVYSASKYEQRVTQAPASVTIVTADEIRRFGHRTLADVLQSVRGVYVTYERNYSNLGMRGFARPGDFNTRVLLLVDGHRMNDNLYSSALIGSEGMVDIDLADRVEVIRGPSSSIYGNSAFFGVINLITRQADDIGGLETAVEGGSFATGKVRAIYGHRFANGAGLVLSGSYYDTQGQERLYFPEFDTPETNHGVAEDADDERAQNWFGHLDYGALAFTAGYARRDKHVPTASFGTVFNDGRLRTADERIFADLKFEREFAGEWRGLGRVYYDRYAYDATYPYNYAAPGDPPFVVLNFDDNYGEGIGADFQLTGRLSGRHTVIVGAEYRRDLHLYQSSFTEQPRTFNARSDLTAASTGIYAQGEFALPHDLLLSVGLRFDHYSDFGDTFNPRLGVIYNPQETTTVKLLYGTAFRAANSYELYLNSPGYAKANPGLGPEKIRTYELVYEQYLPHNLRLGLSGYYYDIKDLISQRYDPQDALVVFQNIGSVTAHGWEVELEGRYARGLIARASYAWQRAQDGRTDALLNNSPRQMAKLNVVLPVPGAPLFAGLELQYLDRLETLAGRRTEDFLITNATLSGQLPGERLQVSVTAYNVFDTGYAFPGSTGNVQDVIPQNGRSFRLKLAYRF